MSAIRKFLAYFSPMILPVAAGAWQPFAGGLTDYRNIAIMAVAGLVAGWLGLQIHPNGVNGPPGSKV